MFLKRLFGKAASPSAPADQSALRALAAGAGDAAARRDACRQLLDPALLRRLAAEDPDAAVRAVAEARYQRLLCGAEPGGPALEVRLTELAALDATVLATQRLLAAVAVQAPEAEGRAAALARLTDQTVLAERALNDPLAANRLLAADRLTERAALERVAKGSSKRDKNVYRLVRQRLRDLAEAAARPRKVRAEAEALCERLSRLGRFDQWTQDCAVLEHLQQQWAAIAEEVPAELRTRYEELRGQFLAAHQTWLATHGAAQADRLADQAAQAEGMATRQRLLAELTDLPTGGPADAETYAGRLAELVAAWDDLGAPGAGSALGQAWDGALAAARAHHQGQLAAERREALAGRLLADAEALLAAGGVPERKALAALQKRWEALGAGPPATGSVAEGGAPPSALAAAGAALDRLNRRVEKHREHLQRKLAGLSGRRPELDRLIETGELRRAEPLYQSIAAAVEQARTAGLPAAAYAELEAGLRQVAPRLRELRQWRRWSADEHRQSLCQQAEALAAEQTQPLGSVARRLAELQQDWRALERTGAPAKDAERERFHSAIAAAQARCEPWLEAQAARFAQNLHARESLCEQLETFLAQVDWSRIDWKKALKAEREMRQAWADLDAVLADEPAPTPGARRQQLRLQGRFRRALRALDRALAEERARNQALRRDLIERMRALAHEPDLRRAVEGAKALQQQWVTTVPGHQREENALWQEFRAASDRLFGRRQAEQEARNAELRDHQAAREAIAQELSDAAAGDDATAIEQAITALSQRWRDTSGLPLSRAGAAAVERQWHAALARARARIDALRAAGQRAVREHLARLADWCDDTAARVRAAPAGLDADQLRAEWNALSAAGAVPAKSVAETLGAAAGLVLAAIDDPAAGEALAAQMAANAARRATLCLHLEIIAGVPSPAEQQERRMRLQVQRLRERIGEGAVDPLADADALLLDWYQATPATRDPDLDARFERARTALTAPAAAPPVPAAAPPAATVSVPA